MRIIWAVAGFCSGAAGICLGIRHIEFEGRWPLVTKVVSTLVPAVLVGLFTGLVSTICSQVLGNFNFFIRFICLGLLNVAFLVVPEAVTVLVEKEQEVKKK